jgi:hypothetical protein
MYPGLMLAGELNFVAHEFLHAELGGPVTRQMPKH